jgi:hypothetical protein
MEMEMIGCIRRSPQAPTFRRQDRERGAAIMLGGRLKNKAQGDIFVGPTRRRFVIFLQRSARHLVKGVGGKRLRQHRVSAALGTVAGLAISAPECLHLLVAAGMVCQPIVRKWAK